MREDIKKKDEVICYNRKTGLTFRATVVKVNKKSYRLLKKNSEDLVTLLEKENFLGEVYYKVESGRTYDIYTLDEIDQAEAKYKPIRFAVYQEDCKNRLYRTEARIEKAEANLAEAQKELDILRKLKVELEEKIKSYVL